MPDGGHVPASRLAAAVHRALRLVRITAQKGKERRDELRDSAFDLALEDLNEKRRVHMADAMDSLYLMVLEIANTASSLERHQREDYRLGAIERRADRAQMVENAMQLLQEQRHESKAQRQAIRALEERVRALEG